MKRCLRRDSFPIIPCSTFFCAETARLPSRAATFTRLWCQAAPTPARAAPATAAAKGPGLGRARRLAASPRRSLPPQAASRAQLPAAAAIFAEAQLHGASLLPPPPTAGNSRDIRQASAPPTERAPWVRLLRRRSEPQELTNCIECEMCARHGTTRWQQQGQIGYSFLGTGCALTHWPVPSMLETFKESYYVVQAGV